VKSILITGGSGTVGQALARHAMRVGVERICIYSRGEAAQADMRNHIRDERLRYFIGDVRDQQRLMRAMCGVDTVFHAAALKRIEVGVYNPIEMVRTNVDGSMNVIEAAIDAGVDRVVAISTDKAHEPISPYGYSKALSDSLLLAANNTVAKYGPSFTVVRLGNVAGSTGSVIPTWRTQAARGERLRITDPDCTRFWISPTQAASYIFDAARLKGALWWPSTLSAYRLGDLAETFERETEIIGLHDFEKKHETMCDGVSSEHAPRLSVAQLRDALCAL
jgi:UDP-N-acetylglucosamine 4,6-dehydratase